MTTISNNKLTDERVSNATLIRLIQWADQHNSHYVAAALCELQERRKADSAEPAPIVPETLPCSVELKPSLIIGKGCKTETLLTALKRRADYYAELEALTPEQRAEHDAGIAEFIESFGNSEQLNSPVTPDGYALVPVEPTDEMIEAAMNCEDVLFNSDESFCVQFGNIYEAMLAAAPQPEGNNG
ncbi:hypothetical protein CFJ47_004832 [Salmonella enterica]|nr:hypothetical protein [Salmonella enterica]ELL0451075.1 hypothetical protein [Salmonella enterica]ELM4169255.1 hypothetical protein [Salmonella enterica]